MEVGGIHNDDDDHHGDDGDDGAVECDDPPPCPALMACGRREPLGTVQYFLRDTIYGISEIPFMVSLRGTDNPKSKNLKKP